VLLTFGTEEEFRAFVRHIPEDARALMEVFRERLVKLVRNIWGIQADALENMQWTM
jgi:hypothetical protein